MVKAITGSMKIKYHP